MHQCFFPFGSNCCRKKSVTSNDLTLIYSWSTSRDSETTSNSAPQKLIDLPRESSNELIIRSLKPTTRFDPDVIQIVRSWLPLYDAVIKDWLLGSENLKEMKIWHHYHTKLLLKKKKMKKPWRKKREVWSQWKKWK